ncbi:TPA: transcription elongation factor GreA [Patescibacteria group bacterium]|uniref:Transcription elongation factor GreA n=2 Tax=Bacteria division Kazan-3B-28 TaxID=1798534 RepID=A0A0G2A3V9_UNCK3|nr:MAG: transcription elongation factor GreA, transcription elongation factor GreA [candidate division Kazan bacterium GW2011_GWA1_50_15]KKW25594.1 MAG: Transcription elongation factor GreA [candidate division Kazan bacterium GW2011_GWC1_52_13]KKW26899.1 MAG: Transcription elongation factor GreA [candidate division Kazan bacterium GW2011_GWB1_52_7]HAV66109.1 transcription elongation factor GreA [Patescibacteria group bacterium]HCL47663.1 transcription elongation factor GreA [Patescibacteria gro
MGVQELYISQQGLENLKRELEELKQQRVEITEKIKDAREFGDLSENAEYQEAKTKQSFIEGRIEEIEATLKMAKVIDAKNNANGEISVGSTVVVDGTGREVTYQIVGSNEVSPEEGKISNESPLGVALMGHRAGDRVMVPMADGEEREYLIVKVS